jgi:hypothetical protein
MLNENENTVNIDLSRDIFVSYMMPPPSSQFSISRSLSEFFWEEAIVFENSLAKHALEAPILNSGIK